MKNPGDQQFLSNTRPEVTEIPFLFKISGANTDELTLFLCTALLPHEWLIVQAGGASVSIKQARQCAVYTTHIFKALV